MGHFLGGENLIFLIREIDDATMTAAPVESCQSVARRSPWARLGSELDVGNRLRRMRGALPAVDTYEDRCSAAQMSPP